jgi:inhibitor of cysteine peptidase
MKADHFIVLILVLAVLGVKQAGSQAAEQKANPADPAKAAAAEPKAAAGEAKTKSLELTKADNGKPAKLAVGDSLVIRLAGNPTTGFSWRTAKLTGDAVKDAGEPNYQTDARPQGMVGVGGTYTFTFKAVKEGKSDLELAYSRPWEKDTPPVETFKIAIDVTAK